MFSKLNLDEKYCLFSHLHGLIREKNVFKGVRSGDTKSLFFYCSSVSVQMIGIGELKL